MQILSLRRHKTAPRWTGVADERFHLVDDGGRDAFRDLGCGRGRGFFPHRIYYVPKLGPDALQLAEAMAGIRHPDALWLVTVHAHEGALHGLPPELFTDDDIVWHRQGCGVGGHVAYAVVGIRRDTLYVFNAVSDLVQRISRRPAVRSRVENRFGGWSVILLNAVVHFARLRGMSRVRWPTADWVLAHVDPARDPGRELFDRVYDRTPGLGWVTDCRDRWWEIVLRENRGRGVAPEPRTVTRRGDRTLCLLHDIERGRGHLDVDPEFARAAEAAGWEPLERILEVEDAAGVRGTYAVIGALLPDVRSRIEEGGHEVAFHSYDHGSGPQLRRCRDVDYRIEGYRPPRSRLTREVRGRALRRRNFQWLASSESSLDTTLPVLDRRVVLVPIFADDFPLHTGATSYDDWEAEILRRVERRPFTALSLHDCYAPRWIDRYPRLLERLAGLAEIRRVGRVADELVRGAAV